MANIVVARSDGWQGMPERVAAKLETSYGKATSLNANRSVTTAFGVST
jgi:hypothetical protein